MKKIIITVLVLIAVIISVVFINQTIRKTGKAYVLAEELKTAGLPVVAIRINENSSMYNEVTALGDALNVKIGYYGNGLFMENIIKNLEAGRKKDRVKEEPAILVSRLYILVVYAEPDRGMTKKILEQKFGQVREY